MTMRVSTKALATASALLFLSSCVTPPPMDRGYGGSPGYQEAPVYDRGSYDNGYERGYEEGRGYYSRPSRGRLSLLLGRRSLDEASFSPIDEPVVLGIEFNQIPPPGGIGFEFGAQFSFDEEDNVVLPNTSVADLALRQAEVYAGVRTELGHGQFRPYIGGGGTLLSATQRTEQGFLQSDEDDNVLGAYIHGGIQADINHLMFLGLDYRHVFADDYDIGGSSLAAEYSQLSLVVGFTL